METMVMRSIIKSRNFSEVGGYEWWIISNPLSTRGSRKVERGKAKEHILENGLVMVVKNEDGEIYDTPDRAFQRKWKGKVLDTKDHKERFEKIWNK